MRLLVCGGRDFAGVDAEFDALNRAHRKRPITCIIHGDCYTKINADKISGMWARSMGITEEKYTVDTSIDGPWPAAGNNRNTRMLRDGKPDAGLAMPGHGGTHDMVTKMWRAGLKVWEPYKKVD